MGILLGRRRQVGIKMETPAGTATAPNLTTDAIPLLREGTKMEVQPISVERPTLRLTQTPIGDIYPGKSLGTITVVCEVAANSAFTGDADSAAKRSAITRLLQACMYKFGSDAGGTKIHGYKVTPPASPDAGPLRHGELVTGTGVTAGNFWTVIGDSFADDGILFVAETANEGGLSGGTLTGQTSTSAFAVSNRGGDVYAWTNTSDFNALIAANESNATVDLYDDGKRYRIKGAVGNVEFAFDHGAPIIMTCTLRGVVDSYVDTALIANAFEAHKVPPTFLGTRVTLRRTINAPATAEKYGTGGGAGGGITGALNSLKLRSGNEIVLHENSMDPNGVNFAIITGRAPDGEFNPDEVLETEFSFQTYFFNGRPLRLRISAVGPDASSVVFDNPTTSNQNIFDFIAPGAVISGLGDGSRDGINAWQGAFKLTGGNYTSAIAQSETPGQDNELTIIHR